MSTSTHKRSRRLTANSDPDPATVQATNPVDANPVQKKPRKASTALTTPVEHTTETLSTQIRSGFDLNRAIKLATDWKSHEIMQAIGYSVTKFEKDEPPTPAQQEVLGDIRAVYDGINDISHPYKVGTFGTSFHLKVTRPGCEFDGDVVPSLTEDSAATCKLLKAWYANAAVSGYGDVKSLETKVDAEVRDAREILAHEFTVDPEFLERVRRKWADHFIPGDVRVEPYKIHIYGPRGHFKSHRDTPEKDLVGTFLVGLGDVVGKNPRFDSWSEDAKKGNFCIGRLKPIAHPCTWVAFHPDVPHSISKLREDAYRAVLALKIFQDGTPTEHEAAVRESKLQERMQAILETIPTPFGILFDHKYYMGISNLNGFDAVLLSAARKLQKCRVHVLPVLIKTSSERHEDESENPNEYSTSVLPFTEAHVDLLLSYNLEKTAKGAKKIKWLEDVEDVPFYSRDFTKSAETWRHEEEELNYIGNESDGKREDSLYLSHALLVLPAKKK